MRVIYVDLLFVLNGVVDYLLLLAAARIAGEPLLRLRFLAGAVFGGGYAVLSVLPGLDEWNGTAARVGAVALMLVLAYGGRRHLLRQSVLFLALSCMLAGGMLALCLLGRERVMLENGVIYTPADVKRLLLSAAACYVVSSLFLQKMGRHCNASGEVVNVELLLGGRKVELKTLIDTGNTLTDPLSGREVMVAEGERLQALCPLERRDLEDPTSALERLSGLERNGRFQLLPYRSVGVERGLLLALRVDRMIVDGKDLGTALVALSPNPVSDGGGYQALLGPHYEKGGRT